MTKTITRADISDEISNVVGLSRSESSDLLETVLEEMSQALVGGSPVKVSSFGTFETRKKGQRIGRNPKSGEEVPISPRTVLTFRASHILKDMVAKGEVPTAVPQPSAPTGGLSFNQE